MLYGYITMRGQQNIKSFSRLYTIQKICVVFKLEEMLWNFVKQYTQSLHCDVFIVQAK